MKREERDARRRNFPARRHTAKIAPLRQKPAGRGAGDVTGGRGIKCRLPLQSPIVKQSQKDAFFSSGATKRKQTQNKPSYCKTTTLPDADPPEQNSTTQKRTAAPSANGNGRDKKDSKTEVYLTAPEKATSRRVRIQQLIRDAHDSGKVSDPAAATARAMADFVLDDYAEPVCTAPVCMIAMKRGKSERSILRHVRELERAGLVIDTTSGNGLRGVSARGQIALGISFAPGLSIEDELRAGRNAKRDEIGLVIKLRKMISALRAHLVELADVGVQEWLATLPRRYNSLSAEELKTLEAECMRYLQAMIDARRDTHAGTAPADATKMSDGPDRNVRPITNTDENKNEDCTRHKRHERSAEEPAATGHNTLTIDKVMPALSDEWREMLEVYFQNGISIERAFAYVAEQMFCASGGSARAWQIAQDRIRNPILLACLVLIAEKTPPRSPDKWLVAMASRAKAGRVNWISPLKGLARMRVRLNTMMAHE